ncbi:hypothetical protein M9H77_17365 [Catharanthus roseus]|uniref:Uncharacterized protein n=1 Tax=Catharanthus roseus TaxID=4058 RepID=A0ACC0B4D9_CATRO|nr:hypothetical protein M9H77_17365 [Catharanthus roseus]
MVKPPMLLAGKCHRGCSLIENVAAVVVAGEEEGERGKRGKRKKKEERVYWSVPSVDAFSCLADLGSSNMGTGNFLWNLSKNYFMVGLIGLTVSDRYFRIVSVQSTSVSPTSNSHVDNSK